MTAGRPERGISVGEGEGCLRGQFQAMASPCEVLCEIDDPAEARRLTSVVAAEAWRIEDKFSRYLPGNIIDRINKARGSVVEVDEETAQLIDFSVTLHELSERRFDITSGALRQVWKFDGSSNIPSVSAVKKVLRRVGWDRVRWNSPQLEMQPEMEIDLGGIGKEYAVDRAASILRNASSASFLINFGGDLAVVREPRRRKSWKVGVESAGHPSAGASKLINLKTGALATSGDARRYLICDQVRYSHILDPLTGWPVPDAPRSITVAAETCTQAGMLSTLAMLKGAQAEAFLEAQGIRYWCDRG